jgi:hypothetical protein
LPEHTVPHAPQFDGSDCVSEQKTMPVRLWHGVSVPEHVGWHTPLEHVAFAPHCTQLGPQLFGSDD